MKHDFKTTYCNTAGKDGKKYLGKDGTQAWRVVTVINGEKYANMIWEEAMLPVQGREYNIELSEKDGFKNWAYKILSKKEQILGDAKEVFDIKGEPTVSKTESVDWDAIAEGKVRHGVALEYIKLHKGDLTDTIKAEIDKWTQYIITGK